MTLAKLTPEHRTFLAWRRASARRRLLRDGGVVFGQLGLAGRGNLALRKLRGAQLGCLAVIRHALCNQWGCWPAR